MGRPELQPGVPVPRRHPRRADPLGARGARPLLGPSSGGYGAAPALAAAAERREHRSPAARAVISLSAGDRVLHPKFGMGTVVSTLGSGDKAEASVDFGSEGVKRLLLRYAPVERL